MITVGMRKLAEGIVERLLDGLIQVRWSEFLCKLKMSLSLHKVVLSEHAMRFDLGLRAFDVAFLA